MTEHLLPSSSAPMSVKACFIETEICPTRIFRGLPCMQRSQHTSKAVALKSKSVLDESGLGKSPSFLVRPEGWRCQGKLSMLSLLEKFTGVLVLSLLVQKYLNSSSWITTPFPLSLHQAEQNSWLSTMSQSFFRKLHLVQTLHVLKLPSGESRYSLFAWGALVKSVKTFLLLEVQRQHHELLFCPTLGSEKKPCLPNPLPLTWVSS